MKKSFGSLCAVCVAAGVVFSSIALADNPILPENPTIAIIDNGSISAPNTKPSDFAYITAVKFQSIVSRKSDGTTFNSPLSSPPLTPLTNLHIGPYDQALNVTDNAIPEGSYMVTFRVANVTVQQGKQTHVVDCSRYPGTVTAALSVNVVDVNNRTADGSWQCVIVY